MVRRLAVCEDAVRNFGKQEIPLMMAVWLFLALVVSSAVVVGFWLKVEDSPKR